jgi:cyanophycinase
VTGWLALVGGNQWTEGCTFDRRLLDASGATEVVVLPTAAAYENPDKQIARAVSWFEAMGASVAPIDVLNRRDAFDAEHVARVRNARFIYLADGGSLHLRSVLKDSPVYAALVEAWQEGAVLAGAGAGADVLCDPMVDTRGGAFTVGLGLLHQFALIPRYDTWSPEKVHRTADLAPPGVTVVGVPQSTALIRDPDGVWSTEGVGEVTVFVDGQTAALADLTA